ncbi:carbohydrate ABC transporter permease [Vallitalea guaymasensis]|uniref:carbohydrate ABC transporter permease n=1 Tax=Vallitalea guaymasensis TaxID=1185412 RepID=UPI001FD63273|nr:sugar ABC transporter permease [Vallitalea guaymasensis]
MPIFFTICYSLNEWNGIGESVFVGIRNYRDLVVEDGFIKAVINSLVIAASSIMFQIPIGLFFALILARGIKGESLLRNIYFIPFIISTVVVCQLWMKIYHPHYGLLNLGLEKIGLENLINQWLGNRDTALVAVIVPIIWQYIGYHMLLLYTSIKSIPKDIYEAAYIDGASNSQISFRITIPLIRPMLKTCITLALIGALKIFDQVYLLTGGGPLHASEVPSTLMFQTIFHKSKYGYGSSMAVFIIVECLILTLILQKAFKTRQYTY